MPKAAQSVFSFSVRTGELKDYKNPKIKLFYIGITVRFAWLFSDELKPENGD